MPAKPQNVENIPESTGGKHRYWGQHKIHRNFAMPFTTQQNSKSAILFVVGTGLSLVSGST